MTDSETPQDGVHINSDELDKDERPADVRVAAFGMAKVVGYEPGLTVETCLNIAEVELADDQMVTLNAEPVEDLSEPVNPGDSIAIASNIANG